MGARRLHLLISAGPTREPIDPVRFLSNYSTGFLGACVAREALRRGHRVTLVSGPSDVRLPRRARVIRVEQARDMAAALRRHMPSADALIMAAAVCDFRPQVVSAQKLARRGRLRLALRSTPDIVAHVPRRRGQVVVGFALETTAVRQRALAKLKAKHLDLIVAQHLSAKGARLPSGLLRGGQGSASGGNGTGSPFGARSVRASLLDAQGRQRRLGVISKPRLARALLDEIETLCYGGKRTHGKATG